MNRLPLVLLTLAALASAQAQQGGEQQGGQGESQQDAPQQGGPLQLAPQQGPQQEPDCDWFYQRNNLITIYMVTNNPGNPATGRGWLNASGWEDAIAIPPNSTCEVPGMDGRMLTMPDYCCWFGVQCCVEETCPTVYDGSPLCDCPLGFVTSLDLSRNGMFGPLPIRAFVGLQCSGALKVLMLTDNWIGGPVAPLIGNMEGLYFLSLQDNLLSGPIPPQLGSISTLKLLDLSYNNFVGPVEDICANNNLMHLYLRGNFGLEGAPNLTGCSHLEVFEAHGMQGQWPIQTGASHLLSIGMNNANVSGPIPPTISESPMLNTLFMGGARLEGSIPKELAELRYMRNLRMGFNNISGTLPPELFVNAPLMEVIRLPVNWINGTLPAEIGMSFALFDLSLADNALYGTIPDSLGNLAMLGKEVDLRGNYLHCCGRGYNGNLTTQNYSYFDMDAPRVPSFLKLSEKFFNYKGPTISASGSDLNNMRCPSLYPSDKEDTEENQLDFFIDAEYYMYEGCLCDSGFELRQVYPEPKVYDIGYVGYGNVPTFDCLPVSDPWYVEKPWALVLLICAVVISTVLIIMFFLYFTGVHTSMLRWYTSARKRLRGEPSSGSITVLCASIEQYAELMGLGPEPPEPVAQAMEIYLNVIQKAGWANFAHTVECSNGQIIMIFPEEIDAVAFSLQVQQALMLQPWPEDLFDRDHDARSFKKPRRGKSVRMLTWASRALSHTLSMRRPSSRSSSYSNRIASSKEYESFEPRSHDDLPNHAPKTYKDPSGHRSILGMESGSWLSINTQHGNRSSNSVAGWPVGSGPLGQTLSPTLPSPGSSLVSQTVGRVRMRTMSDTGAGSPARSVKFGPGPSPNPNELGTVRKKNSYSQQAAPAEFRSVFQHPSADVDELGHTGDHLISEISEIESPPSVTDSHRGQLHASNSIRNTGRSSRGSRVTANMQAHEVRMPRSDSLCANMLLFNGLRIRMGISSGWLKKHEKLSQSSIYTAAKVICEAGAGGQVLMDEVTFLSIKDRLEELAAVDHEGLNIKRMIDQKKASIWKSLRTCMRGIKNPENAVLLDMGTYVYSSRRRLSILMDLSCPYSTYQSLKHRSDVFQPPGTMESRGSSLTEAASSSSSETLQASVGHRVGSQLVGNQNTYLERLSKGEKVMHLYQILAPQLVQRAKLFGSTLQLAPEWICVEQPYFSAPCTQVAPIVELNDPMSGTELPMVTMVFCSIEGGQRYRYLHQKDAQHVHDVIASVVRNTLRQCPGGYLCRMIDGALKYMLAFPSAHSALQWCLVAQECFLYAPWPASALRFWPEERNHKGQVIFRGPRMKMGLNEGSPRTVFPDHLGRADYIGTSVNQAARYMDAGAHGGQVVCCQETALKAMMVMQQPHSWSTMLATYQCLGPSAPGPQPSMPSYTCHHSLPSVSEDEQAQALLLEGELGTLALRKNSSQPQPSLPSVSEDATASGTPANESLHTLGASRLAITVSRVSGDLSSNLGSGPSITVTNPTFVNHQQLPDPAAGLDASQGGAQSDSASKAPSGRVSSLLSNEPASSSFNYVAINSSEPNSASLATLPELSPVNTSPSLSNLDFCLSFPPLQPPQGSKLSNGTGNPSRLGSKPPLALPAASPRVVPSRAPAVIADQVPVLEERDDSMRDLWAVGASQRAAAVTPAGGSMSAGAADRVHSSGSTAFTAAIAATGSAAIMNGSVIMTSNPLQMRLASGMNTVNASEANNNGHIPAHVRCVSASRIGVFQFKGDPAPVNMVMVSTDLLSARRFPLIPPKGKGARLAEGSGLVHEIYMALPDLVQKYKEMYIHTQGRPHMPATRSNLGGGTSERSTPEGGIRRTPERRTNDMRMSERGTPERATPERTTPEMQIPERTTP